MENNLYNIWESFINDINYIKYVDPWLYNLTLLKNFIDLNHRLPIGTINRSVEEKHLYNWYAWNFRKNSKKMVRDNADRWQEFLTDPLYRKYFTKHIK